MYLVLYAYYNGTRNLDFFCRHAVFPSDEVDFVFVVKGGRPEGAAIPNMPNVRVVVQDKNEGLDFGAWSLALASVPDLMEKYHKFIFLNDTVRGPFFPPFLARESLPRWHRIFTGLLDDKTKLTGATINNMSSHPMYSKHVQSMAFATDRTGLELLMRAGIFDYGECVRLSRNKWAFIVNREIRMSDVLLRAGYLINDLFVHSSSRENDIHYTFTQEAKPSQEHRLWHRRKLHPLEVMFIKTNRVDTEEVKVHSDWMDSNVHT